MRKKQTVTPKVGSPTNFINCDSGKEEGWSRLSTSSPVLPKNEGHFASSILKENGSHELSMQEKRRESLRRLKELIERNRNLAPHLRSSYVVEGLEGLASETCDENHLDPERAH